MFNDPLLLPHAPVIRARLAAASSLEQSIRQAGSLTVFADYHKKLGLHLEEGGWVFREWAPNAQDIYILCDQTQWQADDNFRLEKKSRGIFEIRFPKERFSHGALYRLRLIWPGGQGDRIPTAARRVVQDPVTLIFNAQVWQPDPYECRYPGPILSDDPLFIYEAHVGMAQEERGIGTYGAFTQKILPRIQKAGYNTIQLMALPEHPYYGSFGYHVGSYFAPSSRFGTPEELKQLIDEAHGRGLRVLMDMVHSHSVRNEVEGLSRFDGTLFQFFHEGPRGVHSLWDSRCFDYERPTVLRFLLSSLRYWMEEFHVDGFRFDGITSMLYLDHGLGRAFTSYDDYFGPDVDTQALSYLSLANTLVHEINDQALTIAEDVSGYPGLAAGKEKGGAGFDYRFSMGVADYWIRLLKDSRDEHWHLGTLWHELTTRRPEEKTISYAECHDQSLVGDKTLMMHLMGGHIYHGMQRTDTSIETVRAVALHKLIRLITLATANAGFLAFMGNEFGHPEWVDFPSAANGYSFEYARRQWSLRDAPDLLYGCLALFDQEMLCLARDQDLFAVPGPALMLLHEDDRVMAFERNNLIFVFSFHHAQSHTDYPVPAPPGRFRMILDTDEARFGGQDRLTPGQVHFTRPCGDGGKDLLHLYLPTRTGLVLARE